MGVTRQQAAENRQAIVAAAEVLFRERGVDAVGLTELMKAAGFTQGGFYNHFKSKDALVAAVMEKAVEDARGAVAAALGEPHGSAHGVPAAQRARQVAWYLSDAHRDNVAAGCPIAGFIGDAARVGGQAQACYAEGVARALDALTAGRLAQGDVPDAQAAQARRDAIAQYAQMVGTLVLSRALAGADAALADEILASSRRSLVDAIGA